MRKLRGRHNWLFALGLMLAILISALGPVMHAMLAFHTPWRSGDIETYDLRPDTRTLVAYHVGHWSVAVAGLLGALLVLGAAPALPSYTGGPLAVLAILLGYWNVMPITGNLLW